MQRRKAIQSLGLITTHVLFPGVLAGFLSGCARKSNPDYTPEFFNLDEIEQIRKMVDIILPQTKTAAASAVNTHLFIDQVCNQVMTPDQQQLMRDGIAAVAEGFIQAPDQTAFLTEVDQKAYAGEEGDVWFVTFKKLTLIGFFTSQEGTTKASNYVKIPDEYKGDIPADKTTLNYGKTSLHFEI